VIEKGQDSARPARASRAPDKLAFPVNLLLDGRKTLVAGGGRVALDKVRLLRDAGAEVTVVSAEMCEDLEALPEKASVTFLRRELMESDLDGIFLVFAASDDRILNSRVVDLCRARGILCSSVDGNWAAGDFAVPVILRKDDLTVTISTGGRPSRRARMIKDQLSRQIEHADSTSVLVIGTSHEYLSIDRREPYHLVGQRLERTGIMLMQLVGVQEFILLNTCNRVELHALVSDKSDMTALLGRVLGFDQLGARDYYVKRQYDAFAHAAMLSAGLFSQSPGEYHIVSQVKEALGYAVRAGWAGGVMQEWVSTALHISKEIRNTTGQFLKDLEIEDLCISYLQAKRADLEHARILVLGSGVVGSMMVEKLVRMGLSCDWCYHIKRPELPESWAGKVTLCGINDLRSSLSRTDVIVCATFSPHLVLMKEHAPSFDEARKVLIVDLTMPRNVDPALGESAPNVTVADLEDLKDWYDRETEAVEKALRLGRQIVDENRSMYDKLAGALLPAR
jgi:glutamyl-tRNA reductase